MFRMKRMIVETMLGASLLFGSVAYSQNTANAGEAPKANVTLTEVVDDKGGPISRAEALISKLPANADLYFTYEARDGKEYYKLRGQALLLKLGQIVEAGIAAQYAASTGTEPAEQVGPVLRVKGSPIEGISVKADTRYFPKQNDLNKVLDGYLIVNGKHFFADLLWKYDLDSGKGSFRPGIDYKLGKNVYVGIEGKFAGEPDNLKKDYVGLRAKINF
jgi:hypothetical protein